MYSDRINDPWLWLIELEIESVSEPLAFETGLLLELIDWPRVDAVEAVLCVDEEEGVVVDDDREEPDEDPCGVEFIDRTDLRAKKAEAMVVRFERVVCILLVVN